MGLKPKAVARVNGKTVIIPFPAGDEVAVAPPLPTLPHEPTGVTASAGLFDVLVNLAWTDASTNETGFYVYRNTTNTTTGATLIATLAAGSTTYTDNDDNSGANAPVQGTTYFYWVSSYNLAGESAKSPAASNGTGGVTTIWLVPATPTNLSATAVSSSQINLAWTDNSTSETGFEIFSSTDNLTFSSVATVGAGVTTYNNTGLAASTLYYYKVKAVNPGESSLDSNTATATTQAASGIPTPTFDMNFTTNAYVGAGGRFARSSRGTFVNSSGFIQTAEMNLCAYSEDLSATSGGWVRDGLQAFGSGSTVNAAVAPNGTTTADLITETSVNGGHGMYSNGNGLNLTYGTQYTISLYAKKPTSNAREHVSVGVAAGGHGLVVFNLTNGTYTTNAGWASMTLHSYSIQSAGDGWYRCIVTFSATGSGTTGTGSIRIGPSTASPTNYFGFPSYQGDGVSGVLIWGVQLVAGSSALPYATTTTVATVGTPRITHDPVTLAPLGLLLEPQATNLFVYSEAPVTGSYGTFGATITENNATSPSNTTTAARLAESSGNEPHYMHTGTISLTNAVQYTWSVFAKAGTSTVLQLFAFTGGAVSDNDWANFDLTNGVLGSVGTNVTGNDATIENFGNGWYRCTLTFTATGTASAQFAFSHTNNSTTAARRPVYSGNGSTRTLFLWGWQLEANNTATSYIPTAAATVTRNADGWNLLGTDMSTIWNQSQGSMVASGRPYTPFTSGGFVRAGVGGTNANGYFTSVTNSGRRPAIRVAGTNFFSGPTGSPTSGEYYKSGYAYNQATPAFTGFVNGTAGTTLTNSLSAVTVDKLELGTRIESSMSSGNIGLASSPYIIERFRYWNTALSNADMSTLTT